MAGANPERLRALLTAPVAALGLDLEAIAVTTAGRRRLVRVTVDGEHGVSLDQVALVSHAMSEALDASEIMGEQPYVLEVSSPGVDRPLTEPRHWRRACGRLVRVNLADGNEIAGRLMAVDDSGAVIDFTGGDRRVSFGEVTRARIEVEFSRGNDAEFDPVDEPADRETDESDEDA